MSLRIAIQMDEPASFNPKTDTTTMLGLEAQKRGYTLHYYRADELSYNHNTAQAPLRPLEFHESATHWFTAGEANPTPLEEMDVVLMRQDPPFDMAYITATHILETLEDKTLVVNDPKAVRNAPEKWWMHQYPHFIPPTTITRDIDVIRHFHAEHGSIVIKPLYGYGGRDVFVVHEDGANLLSLGEHFASISREPVVLQKFLPEVKDQDRRVILMDGTVCGVVGRAPAAGEIRANFRVGGNAISAELTEKQQEICNVIGPALADSGLLFAGIDFIGDWLTVVNVTSPTGLRGVQTLYGHDASVDFWDAVEKRL